MSSHLYVTSAPQYLKLYCARLLIIATPVLKAAVKSTKVKPPGNNVRDLIIAHVIGANTQTNKPTDVESYLRISWAHMKHVPSW